MDKRRRLRTLLRDKRGATAVEYGLICVMIVLAMVTALKGVASANSNMWGHVSNEVLNSD